MVRDRLLGLFLPITALWLLTAPEAPAQTWDLDASVGQTAHELSPAAAEVGASMRVRYSGAPWIYAGGGAPFSEQGVFWGTLGIGDRLNMTLRGITFGVDVAAQGHGYLDLASEVTGTGASIEVMPLFSVAMGALNLQLRSGAQYYGQWQDQQALSRAVHASDGVLSLASRYGLISASTRYVRAEEANYPFLGAAAEAYLGPAVIWTGMGRWFADRADGVDWNAGARLQVHAGLELYAAYQRDGFHPLYQNPARASWSVGISRRLGRSRPVLLPIAEPSQPDTESAVTFRLPLAAAKDPPSVAGDFSRWTPVAMTRVGEFWTVTLTVNPGVHTYSFIRGDGTWFVPEGLPVQDDGFGGYSAVLIVR